MCGCGRTSRPLPGPSCTGPNWSRNTKGPTARRAALGNARWTMKPSPRSDGWGVITCIGGVFESCATGRNRWRGAAMVAAGQAAMHAGGCATGLPFARELDNNMNEVADPCWKFLGDIALAAAAPGALAFRCCHPHGDGGGAGRVPVVPLPPAHDPESGARRPCLRGAGRRWTACSSRCRTPTWHSATSSSLAMRIAPGRVPGRRSRTQAEDSERNCACCCPPARRRKATWPSWTCAVAAKLGELGRTIARAPAAGLQRRAAGDPQTATMAPR